MATVTDPEGGLERDTYDTTGALTGLTDPAGQQFVLRYTPAGQLATRTLKAYTGNPNAPISARDVVLDSYAYDPGGRLGSHTDAMGRTTRYTYFGDDLLSQIIASGVKLNGSSTGRDVVLADRSYDEAGHYYAYDDAGRLIRQTVENGATDLITTLTRDKRGLVTAHVDPRGNLSGADPAVYRTNLTYDVASRLIQIDEPSVQVERNGGTAAAARPATKIGYNAFGQPTQSSDPEGRTTVTGYDRNGRRTSITLPSYTPPATGSAIIPTATFTYDAAGRLSRQTDPRGNSRTFGYDQLGDLASVLDPPLTGQPTGGTTVMEYDLLGEQTAQVDPTGARVQATYDDLGRQITTSVIERTPSAASYTTSGWTRPAPPPSGTTTPTG